MALKVKYFIRLSKKTSEANIRMRFTNGKVFDLWALTGMQINPTYWNEKSMSIRQVNEFPKAKAYNDKLESLSQFVKVEFKNYAGVEPINSEWLSKIILKFHKPAVVTDTRSDLITYIKSFNAKSGSRINLETGNPVNKITRNGYEVTLSQIEEYSKKYSEPSFNDIDLEFYNKFVEFLRSKKLAINTIGKRIKTLKVFLNAATEDGINTNFKYKSKQFKVLTEDTDSIYLDKNELLQFYNFDLSKIPHLEKVRDLFIVGCWTGLRFSDLHQISEDKIKDNMIQLKQKKTGGKVNIPIHPTVLNILQKYKMKLPNPISNQKFNDYLKNAANLAKIDRMFVKTTSVYGKIVETISPKHEVISSHAARRSFCTNAYLDNISTLDIMSISGHKTEAAFLRYIKVSDEEHAQRVYNAWMKMNEPEKIVEKKIRKKPVKKIRK